MFVRLPVRGIVTTNYDPALEAALVNVTPGYVGDNFFVVGERYTIPVSEFLMAMTRVESFPRRIAHLHGRYEPVDSIVLSAKDYEKVYDVPTTRRAASGRGTVPSWSLHRKLLWTILATRPVIFVGFSMNDPYLNALLKAVSSDLWRWDEPVHYAVMDVDRENADLRHEQAKVFRREHAVEVIFYENLDGRYEGLRRMIEECIQQPTSRPHKFSMEVRDTTERQPGGIPIGREHITQPSGAEEGTGQSTWLEEQSSKTERGIDLHED